MSVDVVFLRWLLVAISLLVHQTSHATDLNDATLSARHARIGRVVIQVDDVFEKKEALAWPYRLANWLHIDSHEATISAQLLFKPGDLFDRRVLDETERLLRDQRYLNEATIQVIEYHEADNTVDVAVSVHDVWTLSPGFSFGRKGGSNHSRLELEENNLLGFGKRVELWRSQDVDRTSLRLRYQDPNVFGSRWRLATAYASSSDGSEKTINLARPFYSLDTRWAADLTASDIEAGVSRYREGEIVQQFSMTKKLFDLEGGVSDGLEDGWVQRYIAGWRYDDREFLRLREQVATLPSNRTVSYPWVGVELLQDDYIKTRNFDLIRRTEDVHLGLAARLEVGYAATAFGSTNSGPVVGGNVGFGNAISDRQFLLSDFTFGGRFEDGDIRNGSLTAGSRYYLRQNSYSSFFASASGTITSRPDADCQLLLGGDNGLRGYPLRYQSGERSALFTVEERFYSRWQPLKLVDVGAAVFFDAGGVWGSDPYGGEPMGWLKDVGFGLRLGNARSALGNVLHIDLAFPLDGPPDISRMQVVVETRRSF